RTNQRGPKGQPMGIEAAEQAVLQSPPAHAGAEGELVRERLLGGRVADKLDALKQTLAANVADDTVLLCQPLKTGLQPVALRAGVRAQVPFQDLLQHR